jgi:transcriptional regulator with XRE-family HTH domain
MPSRENRKRKRTETQEAIIALRQTRDLTQEGLAKHMNRDTSTIGRWESFRPPRGFSLTELAEVAHEFGRDDLAAVFKKELDQESAVFARIGGLGVVAYSTGFRSSHPLKAAATILFDWANTDHKRKTVGPRAYRKLLKAASDGLDLLIREAAKGTTLKQYPPGYLETLQIELGLMEETEDKRNARK